MYLVTRFGDPFLFHERNAGINHQGTMPEVGEHLSITVNLSGWGQVIIVIFQSSPGCSYSESLSKAVTS